MYRLNIEIYFGSDDEYTIEFGKCLACFHRNAIKIAREVFQGIDNLDCRVARVTLMRGKKMIMNLERQRVY